MIANYRAASKLIPQRDVPNAVRSRSQANVYLRPVLRHFGLRFTRIPTTCQTSGLADLPDRSCLIQAARGFVTAQVDDEWPSMALGASIPRVGQLLDEFWETLSKIRPQDAREEALYAEAISRFNEMCDARTDLLHSSRTRLPPTMWMLIISGGCSTVASMYLFGLEHFWPLAVMTASLAGCVSFVLFVIYDLDNPFNGDWQVRPDPIRLVLDQLETDIAVQKGDHGQE